ncbi:MAG: DUF1853 family protein [Halioglobus sp.]|nr:DUF1853 family protein [Halioglobus sp.]
MRDLAAACFGEPLLLAADIPGADAWLRDARPALTAARRAWLQALDDNPAPLLAFLSRPGGTRVGLYFERLWQFFLAADPATELLAHNLPVHVAGRTLGEFDCLYYCRESGVHVHLELAVKWYLGIAPPADTHTQWLGPDARDTLARKLQHMLTRQLRLGLHAAAQPVLARLGITRLERAIVLRGSLFQPTGAPLPLPSGHNPRNVTGNWLPLSSVTTYCGALDSAGFLPLDRLRWLSGAQLSDTDQALDAQALEETLAQIFARRPRPALVASLDAAGREVARFFVTPPDWPQGARAQSG